MHFPAFFSFLRAAARPGLGILPRVPLLAVVLSGPDSRPEVSEPAGQELALLEARGARCQKVELGFLHAFHCSVLTPEHRSLLLALKLWQNDCVRQLKMGGNNVGQWSGGTGRSPG